MANHRQGVGSGYGYGLWPTGPERKFGSAGREENAPLRRQKGERNQEKSDSRPSLVVQHFASFGPRIIYPLDPTYRKLFFALFLKTDSELSLSVTILTQCKTSNIGSFPAFRQAVRLQPKFYIRRQPRNPEIMNIYSEMAIFIVFAQIYIRLKCAQINIASHNI
jgi:hypothetical protein